MIFHGISKPMGLAYDLNVLLNVAGHRGGASLGSSQMGVAIGRILMGAWQAALSPHGHGQN